MPSRGERRQATSSRSSAEVGVRPLSPLVLQAGHVGEAGTRDEHVARRDRFTEVDDNILAFVGIVVAETRAGAAPLLYAALRGSCALGLASSTLRPTSRSDRPTSTTAPSRTNSCNDGHRDRYAGKLRDEAHAFTTNITHGHGGLLSRHSPGEDPKQPRAG